MKQAVELTRDRLVETLGCSRPDLRCSIRRAEDLAGYLVRHDRGTGSDG